MAQAALQAVLQPVTHRLPSFVAHPLAALVGQQCYQTLVLDVDVTSRVCLRLAFSKLLGLGIVTFGSVLKLPQIHKIVYARSAAGVSLAMYALEVWAYTVSLAYAYRLRLPFSTYGENASLTLQNMIITLLIIRYHPPPRTLLLGGRLDLTNPRTWLPSSLLQPPALHAFGRGGGGGGALGLLNRGQGRTTIGGGASIRVHASTLPLLLASSAMLLLVGLLFHPSLVSPRTMATLQLTTIPASLVSKLPQVAQLHRNRSPGQLSAVVVFAQLLGTVARVFTTATETSDALLLWGFSLATLLNAVIATQYVMYWHRTDDDLDEKRSYYPRLAAPSSPWRDALSWTSRLPYLSSLFSTTSAASHKPPPPGAAGRDTLYSPHAWPSSMQQARSDDGDDLTSSPAAAYQNGGVGAGPYEYGGGVRARPANLAPHHRLDDVATMTTSLPLPATTPVGSLLGSSSDTAWWPPPPLSSSSSSSLTEVVAAHPSGPPAPPPPPPSMGSGAQASSGWTTG